jgi:acetyl esterase/lipase
MDQNSPGRRPTLGNFTDIVGVRNGTILSTQNLLKRLGPVEDTLEETTIQIQVRDGWLAHTTVTRPSAKAKKPPGPLIVLYHGGGFMAGVPESMAAYARGLARLFNAVVVCPAYRLAPEDPFPTAPHDAWDSLKWAAHNAPKLHANPYKGFIVGGVSTGGNFSPVLARKAIEECLEPPLTGHWVGVPVQYRPYTIPAKYKHLWTSWTQNAGAPLISAMEAEILFDFYDPDFRSPLFNPLTTPFDIEDMPPAFVMVAGMDLIRDDGIVYSYTLDDARVPVKLNAYAGVPHSFWSYFPTLPQSRKAMVDIAKGFGWMLKTTVDDKKASDAMLKNY